MQAKQNIQIAIDGPVAAGKGTAAKQLAVSLGFLYVDTGAMYRAATLLFLQKGLSADRAHENELIDTLRQADFQLENRHDETGNFYTAVMLNGQDVSTRIREQDVDSNVAAVASLPSIRELMVKKQQALAENQSVVMEGRDIGTVVLPAADVKFFLTASLEVRAKRRLAQQIAGNPGLTLDEVKGQIMARDFQDTHRQTSPLRATAEAVVLDTTDLSIDETVKQMVTIVQQRLALSK